MDMTNQLPTMIADMVSQLGGRQIFRMAFASCVYDTIDETPDRPVHAGLAGITFKIAPALVRISTSKATHVIVTLEYDDTYTVKTWRAPTAAENRRGEHLGTELSSVANVYCDTLRPVVEKMTGLCLTL